jgi:hypothetical protein
MTTVIYLSQGHVYNDTYSSEESALRAFDRPLGCTIIDIFPGTVTGKDMRRIAKENRAKIAR